jgi:predicted RNA binding protein YcfA (HicA-like mRNA interferase family)
MIKKVKAMIRMIEDDGWVLLKTKGSLGNINIPPSQGR